MKYIIFLLLSLFSTITNSQVIDFIASASPGGPTDTITRRVVEVLHDKTNLKFAVLNKPGGAHTIAWRHMMASNKPMIIISTPEILNHPVINEVEQVYKIGKFSTYIFVSKKSGIRTLDDLKNLSKRREIIFGHSGEGTYSFIGMNELCDVIIKCLPIPYKSGPEGMLAVLTGEIDSYALVSFGSKQFLANDNFTAIHQLKNNNNFITMFSKNVSKSDIEKIRQALKMELTSTFYDDMGFEK
jgi:hypothetical protein